MNTKIDFLYLSQDDVVKAGVTDMHHCMTRWRRCSVCSVRATI